MIKLIIIIFVLAWIWIIYEGWRAPQLEEDEKGNWKVIKPAKKFSDLYKKKEKTK